MSETLQTEFVDKKHEINQAIRMLGLFFSTALLIASIAAMIYTGESLHGMLQSWARILFAACPLVTDYFALGSLAAAFFNAAVCGYCVTLLMIFLRGAKYKPNVWAGYFLVIAHCFYGLNLINMWFPMIGFLFYCKVHGLRFRDNLDWAMFITSFGPFVSEVLFRYPFTTQLIFNIGSVEIDIFRVAIAMLMSVFFGITVPSLLPGTAKLHRGFNLYNGGLATGLLGLFVYSFLYKTMGTYAPKSEVHYNYIYEEHGHSFMTFVVCFYAIVFALCIIYGFFLNGRSFRGYSDLLKDSGHKTNFPLKYGVPVTWINLGVYGFFMLAYFVVIVSTTDGAGFTGATCGIVLAAMTFSASGQHPRNVWPIIAGYILLHMLVSELCAIQGRLAPWTLSTQGYMNGLAFATGLCPFTGVYGIGAGILAGFISAVMCTSTSAIHGGFVLYNGGFTAGITALVLLPLIDTYMIHSERWGRGK